MCDIDVRDHVRNEAIAFWAGVIDDAAGMPPAADLLAQIERGRSLPLEGADRLALVELEFLHSWLVRNFGEDYAKLVRAG